MGVELRMGLLASDVDLDGIDVKTPDGTDRIQAHTVIWAAGVRRRRWQDAGETPRARRSTAPAGWRCCPTARCPVIRRSSPSAT